MSLFITSPTIKVFIGPSSDNQLSIHRSLAISRSEFTARALSGSWANADTNTIDLQSVLPDMDSDHLAQYLEDLYSTTKTLSPSRDSHDIIHVYIIAEALLDRETRNRAVRSLHHFMFEDPDEYLYPNVWLVTQVYAHTAASDNPMRRLLVEVWYDAAELDWFDYDTAPKEFLWDLQMKGFERGKKTEFPAKYDVEEYMELTEEEMAEKKEMEEKREKMRLAREKKERKEKLIAMSRQLQRGREAAGSVLGRVVDGRGDEDDDDGEDEIEDEMFPLASTEDDDEIDDKLFGLAGGDDEDGEDVGIDDEMFPLAGSDDFPSDEEPSADE